MTDMSWQNGCQHRGVFVQFLDPEPKVATKIENHVVFSPGITWQRIDFQKCPTKPMSA